MAGAAGFSEEDGAVMSDINVTPLVDVVLVLLIIFMITVPAIVASAPIKIDLPTTASAQISVEQLELNFYLRKEPSGENILYLNGDRVTDALLDSKVAKDKATRDKQQVLLAADRGIPYGEVIKVMDKLASKGWHKVSLDTKHVTAF